MQTHIPKIITQNHGKISFTAKLYGDASMGSWTFIILSKEQINLLDTAVRVPVKGSINGFAIRTFAQPIAKETYAITINKTMREGAGNVAINSLVDVVLEFDNEPRLVEIPQDFKIALASCDKTIKDFFEKLSFTHKKDYVVWIEGAKRPETRSKRISEATNLLKDKIKLKDKSTKQKSKE